MHPPEVKSLALAELASGATYPRVKLRVLAETNVDVPLSTIRSWADQDREAFCTTESTRVLERNFRIASAASDLIENKLEEGKGSLTELNIIKGTAEDKVIAILRIAQQERVNNSWTAALKRTLAMPDDDRKALVAGILED